MTTTYFTASSLDGFIADPEHSLGWLLSRDIDPRGPMGHEVFLHERVGALAMGSTTYEWILAHETDETGSVHWPYEVPSWVFTSRQLQRVDGDVRFVRGPVAAVHPTLVAAADHKDVWVVGGGGLAAQFSDAGLLDELWVQYAPVTLGAGSPLLPRRLELRLVEALRNRDFACARYAVLSRTAG